ncbi:MAG TPA: polysaccharide biosynthesis tyrosine autokinase [Ramlibacter sp.]|nr:polysaccharide biosynthesis tyrosine autokinase [Ramlibacter sp.]
MSDLNDPPNNLARLPPGAGSTALTLRQPYQVQTAVDPMPVDETGSDSLTLTDLLRIVLKHKWTLLLVLILAGGTSVIRTFLSTPVYRSTVTLQIERTAPRVVRFGNEADQDGWYDDGSSLKTQYELLRSRSLAERVIDELGLDQSSRAAPNSVPSPGLPAETASAPAQSRSDGTIDDYIDRIASGYRKLTTPAIRDAKALSRDAVVGGFLGSIMVEPIRNSRLVKLHVENTDPELAARIANATVQAFITAGLERRADASSYAKTFLEDQIKQIKAKLEESERRLNQFAQSRQILTLDEKTSVINQTYTDYAAALSRAEQDRMKAESLFSEIKRNPDSMAVVSDSKSIQSYKEQKSKLEVEYQQNLRIFKPDFPKMLQIKAQIAEIEAQIRTEVGVIASGMQSQYEAALRQESLIREKLNQTRKQVLSTQDNSIDLNLLKREVETNRQLYDGLLQRLKQVGVSGGVISNNVSVVDQAEAPMFPFKPDLRRNLMVGLAVGLFLGLCLVFLLEYLDDSIRFPDEIERLLGVPLMGIIPMVKKKRGQDQSVGYDVYTDPRSTVAEAYRSVRTALQFSTSEGAPRRLVITSTTRNEGKSTTALALAINFAQMGHQVLLVDGDMRNPSVHKQLGIPNEHGLSNLLSSDLSGEALIAPSVIPNLSILTAGPVPPNPVDLLMGPKLLALLDRLPTVGIQYVIVDAPPLLGIADSVVLGSQIQNILFVVQASRTRKGHIKDAMRRLRLAGLLPRGIVLTQTQRGSIPQDYESYYGYGPAEPPQPLPQGKPGA